MPSHVEENVTERQIAPLSRARRAAVAAFLGTAIEYYEFGVYGYLAVILGPLFFPSASSSVSLLSALAVWGTSFFIRPLGGMILGRLGDRFGRRPILMLTVIGMGGATALTGMLPTHSSVGFLAPLLLLLFRLIQGFFAGGELTGASAYVTESAPTGRRSFYGGFVPMGAAFGGGLAAAIAAITSSIVGSDGMALWGWRIPFLFAIPLIVVSLVIRAKIDESPLFEEVKAANAVVKAPLSRVFSKHKRAVLQVVGLSYGQAAGYWVGIVFMNIYLVETLGYDKQRVLWIVTAVSILAGSLTPLAGVLSDKIGRRKSFIIGFLGYAVLVLPAMMLMAVGSDFIALAAMLILALPFPFVQAAGFTAYAEIFPTSVRFTGVALASNVGTILGGGLSPFLASWLFSLTGNELSPGFLLVAAAVIGLLIVLTLKETAHSDLK
jgi:MHS family proline/betaine transporter-like MFS transporter